jgi:type IX secretion system PorP/SprF family membrane protein
MKYVQIHSKISNIYTSNTSTIRKIGLLISFCFFYNITASAQDIQFSQFYANVLYLNPAFAGSAHKTRLIGHQRLQWPRLDAKYTTSTFSIDHFFSKAKSGLGLMILRDVQGSNIISSTELSLQYSYELIISSKLAFRVGAQGSYASRYINYNYLKFPDQYSVNGFTGQSTLEPFEGNKVNYFDVSIGGLLYSSNFWSGISIYHLNTPDQSFYGDVSNLPMKITLMGGYKFYVTNHDNHKLNEDQEISITPTFNYKSQ